MIFGDLATGASRIRKTLDSANKLATQDDDLATGENTRENMEVYRPRETWSISSRIPAATFTQTQTVKTTSRATSRQLGLEAEKRANRQTSSESDHKAIVERSRRPRTMCFSREERRTESGKDHPSQAKQRRASTRRAGRWQWTSRANSSEHIQAVEELMQGGGAQWQTHQIHPARRTAEKNLKKIPRACLRIWSEFQVLAGLLSCPEPRQRDTSNMISRNYVPAEAPRRR